MISYTKKIDIPFNIYQPKLVKIPVVQREKLRFYEKYIVLALNKGIKASDVVDLKEICSRIYNIKQSFVNDFIDFFFKLGYIKFDEKNSIFYLSKQYEILYDDKDKTIMLAKIEEKDADFSKLVYIEEAKNFLNERDLVKNGFTNSKKEKSILNEQEEEFFKTNLLNKNLEEVRNIVVAAFKEDNSSFSVLESKFHTIKTKAIKKTNYNLEVFLNYDYDGKNSLMTNIKMPSSYELDQTYIKKYCEQFKNDIDLPRFLKFENIYLEQAKSLKEMESLVSQNEDLELKNEKITEDLTKLSKVRASLKNSEEIKEQQQELKKQKEEIKQQILENDKKVKNLEQIISSKHDVLSKEMDPEIKKVYEKYKGNTQFDAFMRDYCVGLDQFLSMCISNTLEITLKRKAAEIRFFNDQLPKPVLDIKLDNPKTKYKTVTEYLSYDSKASKGLSDVYEYFRKDNKLMLLNKMRHYHFEIINPLCHGVETQRADNKKKIEDFLSLKDEEKREYLLSFIRFYGSLTLTNKQKKAIMANCE